ncbi:hypothetical protein CSOJ01_06927 [Colletotrichum sojae]|uniref:Uncharacterized protein n=1 Tax=Colletotrichum sojae TaxID=2175907 RepID=A0A8H6MUE6_9PEZI|nr:hypothetical protein CSOJ01_06927 [Colletotrichum sojae]
MARLCSTSRSRRYTFSVSLDPNGWHPNVASVAAGVGAVAVGLGAAAGAVYTVFAVSEALYVWATSSSDETRVPQEVVQTPGIETSVVNARRGLANWNSDAARVGTVETTAETARAEGYYHSQRLFMFDLLLLAWGERLGEINIIKSCILNHRRFILVRSRSDEIINRILDDEGDEDSEEDRQRVRETAVLTTAEALEGQLKRAGVPVEVLEELLGFCVLVNKNDLPRLSSTDYVDDWPDPRERMTETHERLLIEALGKRRMEASPTSSEGEDTDDEEESKTAEDL